MTDTPDLREQIAKALAEKDGYVWLGDSEDEHPLRRATYLARAHAVEAALPSGTKRLIDTCNLLRDRLAETTRERDVARADYSQLARDARDEIDAATREVDRLRREVEFEANGADTFSGADADWVRGVTQTIFAGNAEGRQGNCLQAAVATLVGVPLETVPHFAESDTWQADLVAFAAQHGYQTGGRGGKGTPPKFGLAFGPTVRSADIQHAVAIVHGETWDPHPSRAGLTLASSYVEWTPEVSSVHPEGGETP